MSKKHYEAIAAALQRHKPQPTWLNKWQQYCYACNDLSDYFASENPKFDRARFLQACGVEQ